MKITEYSIFTRKAVGQFTAACVSDLHARKADKVIEALESFDTDVILLAGDILEVSNEYMRERNNEAFRFLEKIVNIAPVYYCFGNHEIYFSHARKGSDRVSAPSLAEENTAKLTSLGIHLVNDRCEKLITKEGKEICIGGLVCGRDMDPDFCGKAPDEDFLRSFEEKAAFKLLLCHYPHYYEKYIKNASIDLTVSGHAHGGQWRIFGRGVYSPHQGLFPKYTSGLYDGRFIISRGAVNNSRPIPRFFNPTEILKIDISEKQ